MLASAPAMPTSAAGVYDTSNPLGCNAHVQATEGVKTRPLNCSQSSSATPNSATTARNSLR
ncbi:hypothetical protein J2Y41_000912 [Arthrobacter sp. 1088]|nr:hypothetical protein [Arthrobacter sp. 1088]